MAIDLRLPEKPGGPLTSYITGIDLVKDVQYSAPMTWGHIYSAFAKDAALDAYRNACAHKFLPLLVWEKSFSDNAGEHNFTQSEWAGAVLVHLLPRESALRFIASVSESNKKFGERLLDYMNKSSPLGLAMEHSIRNGSKHLPEGLAKSCAIIGKWVDGQESEDEWPAFLEIFCFAETLQHWLWVQAAAWLFALDSEKAIIWPNQEGDPTREQMEKSLADMLQRIADLNQPDWSSTWFSYLNRYEGHSGNSIIEALAAIRELRDETLYHKKTYALSDPKVPEILWQKITQPFRIVLDAATILAAYPIVRRPRPAVDGRWRFELLKGEGTPLPSEEFKLDFGALGKHQDPFAPEPNDSNVLYQMWPDAKGRRGLLKLWPFMEHRSNLHERPTPWL
ncbi:MAG: hypothetical protein ACRESZ_22095, partial [Methylococcales bacterium]